MHDSKVKQDMKSLDTDTDDLEVFANWNIRNGTELLIHHFAVEENQSANFWCWEKSEKEND